MDEFGAIDLSTVATALGYTDAQSQAFFTELQGLLQDQAARSSGDSSAPWNPGDYLGYLQAARWGLANPWLLASGVAAVFGAVYLAGRWSK